MYDDKRVIGLIFCIAVVITALCAIPALVPSQSIQFKTENVTTLNSGWNVVTKDGFAPVTFPARTSTKAGDDTIVVNTLPKQFDEGQTLCIRASLQSLKVFLDNRVIFERGTDKTKFFGKSPGSTWCFVQIPKDSDGKEIKVVLNSPYQNMSGTLNSMVYGNYSSLLFYIIKIYGTNFLSAILALLIGIIMIMLSFLLKENNRHINSHLLYLGLFASLISLWLLGESKMLQFLMGNQYFIANISYFSLLLFPVPMILYLGDIFKGKFHKLMVSILLDLYLVNFIVTLTLHFLKIYDFFESLIFNHILLILSIVTLVTANIIEATLLKNKEAAKALLSVSILVVFGALELYDYYTHKFMTISNYFRIGLLIYILVLSITSIVKVRNLSKQSWEANYYECLAFRDFLTGGKNRNAYYNDTKDVFGQPGKKRIWLALFDMNNLKVINDNYGHAAGDEAIVDAYYCICKAFGSKENCYRIGGDEFAVIFTQDAQHSFSEALERFYARSAALSSNKPYEVKLAIGYELFDSERYNDFESFSCLVDKKMYENKKVLKQVVSNNAAVVS